MVFGKETYLGSLFIQSAFVNPFGNLSDGEILDEPCSEKNKNIRNDIPWRWQVDFLDKNVECKNGGEK
jgi:hypothetical protein